MHINAEDIFLGRRFPVAALLGEGVPPIFFHPLKALALNKSGGVALGVFINRLLPVTAHQVGTALLLEPGKRPLIVAAEVINADHQGTSR